MKSIQLPERVAELAVALCDRAITAEELSELEQSLLSDPDGVIAFTRFMDLHSYLLLHAAQKPAVAEGALTDAAIHQALDKMIAQAVVSDAISGQPALYRAAAPTSSTSGWRGSLASPWWSGTAVALLFYGGFVLLAWNLRPETDPSAKIRPANPIAAAGLSADPKNPIARLTASDGCRWELGIVPPGLGDAVSSKPLMLAAGLVELTFADGAEVRLEGPARFTAESASRLQLDTGRLLARVPPRAVGFCVQTPILDVVDRGTEFGVEVNDAGATEVHVLRGVVETSQRFAHAVKPLRLYTGETIRFDGSTESPQVVSSNGAKFVPISRWSGNTDVSKNYVETVLADRPLAYWPLNEPLGATEVADVSGHGRTGSVHGDVTFGVNGPLKNPASTAAKFDGTGWIIIADGTALAMQNNFTAEAWIEIGDAPVGTGRIVSIDAGSLHNGWSMGWSMDVPHQEEFLFTLHSIQDYYFRGHPLTSHRWHHVVLVCDSNNRAQLYVNGQWTATIDADRSGNVAPSHASIGAVTNGGQPWQGAIAHLAVYPYSLDEKQIAAHYGAAVNKDVSVGVPRDNPSSRTSQ